MANNIDVLDAASATKIVKTTDNATVHTPHHNVELSGTAPSTNSGNKDTGTLRIVVATDQPNLTTPLNVTQSFATVTVDVTRPADTVAYAVNDAISDSTTAPTSGGYTWTSAAASSGGSGIITDVMVMSSNPAGTPLSGELWVFNTSCANVNDNTAFAISDTEVKTLVGRIPFALTTIGNNSSGHIRNLSMGFTASGTANLRFLIVAKNAYTPISAEVFTFVAKIIRF